MDTTKSVIVGATIKLVENAPAIVVLMVVAYHQQQQINLLLERCVMAVNSC